MSVLLQNESTGKEFTSPYYLPVCCDVRFRGHPPPPPQQRQMPPAGHDGEGEERVNNRPKIIKEDALKEFDEILRNDSHDGDWAGASVEIDYRYKQLTYVVLILSEKIC